MKIFLVVPYSESHYFVPPIGIGFLVTSLRRKGFKDSHIIDGVKEHLTLEKFKSLILSKNPDVVGIQVFSSDVAMCQKYAKLLRKISPNTILIIGGAHVSGVGKEIFNDFPEAHFAFRAEAEKGLPMLIKLLEGGRLVKKSIAFEYLEKIPGLIWKNKNKIILNDIYLEHNLDSLGLPAWDLMDIRTYPQAPQGAIFRNWPIAPILTSRGCPYNCTYCANKLGMGQVVRSRSINNIIKEVKLLYYTYGARELHIIDDTFTQNKEKVIEFCKILIKNKIKMTIAFPNGVRLNTLDKEVLSWLKKAGCYSITVGIESGSDKILKDMRKALTTKIIKEKLDLIKQAKIDAAGFFILGYPTETKEDIIKTIKFAKQLPLKRVHFSAFLPLPGTDITEDLKKKGILKKVNWSKLFYTEAPCPPKGMTSKELKKLQRRAFLEFYLRPKIVWGVITDIRSWDHFKALFVRAKDYLF